MATVSLLTFQEDVMPDIVIVSAHLHAEQSTGLQSFACAVGSLQQSVNSSVKKGMCAKCQRARFEGYQLVTSTTCEMHRTCSKGQSEQDRQRKPKQATNQQGLKS